MMKRLILFSFLLVTLINFDIISQSKETNKNNFFYAESLILYEDYKEALPLYQQLLKVSPDNSNFKFRIGQCYLNIPGEKNKATGYFEDAVKNINPEYVKGRFSETGAPRDALYFLANAYRINNQFEKAIETYKLFRKNLNSKEYDTTIVDLQIKSCLNAGELISNPIFFKEKNLGSNINGNYSEFNPVVSDNEDLIVFSRSEPFYDALLYSTKNNGQWTPPLNMNELLKVDRDLYPTSLSKDGQNLYLYSSAGFDGNIYTSRFENNRWTPIVKLNPNINTKYWESHATISHDNKKLYFTSNRKGTLGGLDIYVSGRDSSGDWGPAVNLGPVINTPYNEESPFLSRDDKTLFFSSRGHFNMGGYDIFYSTLQDNGQWSAPVNMGYPLNTTDDDLFFEPLDDGFEGYIAKYEPDDFGKQDIYRIEIFSNDHPRKFFISGMVKLAGPILNVRDSAKISIIRIGKADKTLIVHSDPATGEYKFELPQGKYDITYEVDGGEKATRSFNIPLQYPSDNFELPVIVLNKTYLTAKSEVEIIKTTPVIKSETTKVKLNVKPKSLPVITVPAADTNKVRMDSEIAALISSIVRRSTDPLAKVVATADFQNQRFGKVDDVINYLKEEAVKKGIDPGEVSKLALLIAVSDNILTQAAVDLLASYTDGELKKILSELDIYQSGLKTWTDLQEYIASRLGGKISPEELNRIANLILAKEIPEEITAPPAKTVADNKLWILWIAAGAGLIFFFIVFRKKKKKKTE
jgi:tetratricopeptide (TPR) repeat protein